MGFAPKKGFDAINRSVAVRVAFVAGAAASSALAAGCTPSIGDPCNLSVDCSIKGDRQCDTTQPGGYCTVLSCGANGCPDNAACIVFAASVPGCGFDERVISRTARSQCMKACGSDEDCRGGYVCRDVTAAPWAAKRLDDSKNGYVCVPIEREGAIAVPQAGGDAPVCQRLPGDAGVYDAGMLDAGVLDAAGADTAAGDSSDAGAGDGGAPDGGASGLVGEAARDNGK